MVLVHAQEKPLELWGVSSDGGQYNAGTIFKTDSEGKNISIEHTFFGHTGHCAYGKLLLGKNGKLYGLTRKGGFYGFGVLFEYDPKTDVYEALMDFNRKGEGEVYTNIALSDSGKIYGLVGTIPDSTFYYLRFRPDDLNNTRHRISSLFEYDLKQKQYNKVYTSSSESRLYHIYQSEIMSSYKNKVYGNFGGYFDCEAGKVYDYDSLKSDKDWENNYQQALLNYGLKVKNKTGDIFSVWQPDKFEWAMSIGAYNYFKCYGNLNRKSSRGAMIVWNSKTGKSYPVFFKTDSIGRNPGKYLAEANGNAYGITTFGGKYGNGVLFSYSPKGEYTKLYEFEDKKLGKYPIWGLTKAPNGMLYGVTEWGGSGEIKFSKGVFFQFDPKTNKYKKITDLDDPSGPLTLGENGVLYGLTKSSLYEYHTETGVFKTRFNFGYKENEPKSPSLFFDLASNDKFYGYAYSISGEQINGLLYEFDPKTKTFEVKLKFDQTEKLFYHKDDFLLLADNDKIYGSGIQKFLFEYDPIADKYRKLDLKIKADSLYKHSILAVDGNLLYGLLTKTENDSNPDPNVVKGILLEYNLKKSRVTKKIELKGNDSLFVPKYPMQKIDKATFYGMNADGLFAFNSKTFSFKLINSKLNNENYTPNVYDGKGKFYGFDKRDYEYDLFEYNIQQKKVSVIKNTYSLQHYHTVFYSTMSKIYYSDLYKESNKSVGAIMYAGNGKLYGTTVEGDNWPNYLWEGSFFEYDPVRKQYKVLIDLGKKQLSYCRVPLVERKQTDSETK